MEEKNDHMEYKSDDVMMPGFRFHPTDEELVGFYLKRKIQLRPLPIELIKQVDIYKYDPWDLPRLATSGEKEWYFYCPRDRKYRNSARPNRVTGAGFWKATGTDRPIYSSDGTKCIGLKKSLVFYRGRAAKGIKTDWMMHEFRLPSLGDPSPPKKFLDKSLPPNDAWAICRIFKKINSMAQRALSQSWMSQLGDTSPSEMLFSNQFISSENISCTTEADGSVFHLASPTDHHLQPISPTSSFSASDISPSYRPINSTLYKPSFPSGGDNNNIPSNFMFSPIEISTPTRSTSIDTPPPPMLLNSLIGDGSKLTSESTDFGVSQGHFSEFSMTLSPRNQMDLGEDHGGCSRKVAGLISENSNWGSVRSIGFPFSLASEFPDAWKPNLPWDSPPCPSEMSTSTYPTSKCYI